MPQPISTALPKANIAANITTAPKGRRKQVSKLGEPVAVTVASKRTKKEPKRKATKAQEREQQRIQQQERELEQAQERQMQILQMEREVQQIALLRRQLDEHKEQEEKARKEREFHTHQRRLVEQQRLQDGQHAWKLEWQRQQPQLRERLRIEELSLQAQEGSRPHDSTIPLSDMVCEEYLEFTQAN